MSRQIQDESRPMVLAMTGAAAVTAQIVSGKATRDALFLTSLDYTTLPTMLMATSVCSILLVALNTRAARRLSPSTLVPATFAASGVLFLVEWLLRPLSPAATAVAVYLHISCAGPLLASGFWLVSTERFDPHTAKQRFGQIAGMGTLGGLVSAVDRRARGRDPRRAGAAAVPRGHCSSPAPWSCARWRSGSSQWSAARPPRSRARAPAHAPVPAARNGPGCAWWPRRRTSVSSPTSCCSAPRARRSSTTCSRRRRPKSSAAAISCCGSSPSTTPPRACSRSSCRCRRRVLVLERWGIALSASSPSLALFVGTAVNLIVPGFASLTFARSAEAVFRGSLFRTGYELFYTPMPADDKRAAKSIIDVGLRSRRRRHRRHPGPPGAAVRAGGAGQRDPVRSAWPDRSPPSSPAAGSRPATSRTLENSLLDTRRRRRPGRQRRAHQLDRHRDDPALSRRAAAQPRRWSRRGRPATPLPPDVRDILRLRSRNRDRVMQVLVAAGRADAGAGAARHPVAGLGSPGRARGLRAAQGGRRARRGARPTRSSIPTRTSRSAAVWCACSRCASRSGPPTA